MDLRPKQTGFTGGGSRQASEEVIRLIGIITDVPNWDCNLTVRDIGFVHDMAGKVKSSPRTLWVNSKQLFWLRDIKDKILAAPETPKWSEQAERHRTRGLK